MTSEEVAGAIADLTRHPEIAKVPRSVLADVLQRGAALESERIERELQQMYDVEMPALAKLAGGPHVPRVIAIIRGRRES